MDKIKKYALNVWVGFQWVLCMLYLSVGVGVQMLLCIMLLPAIGFKKCKLKYKELDEVSGFLKALKAFASLETFKKYLH